MKKSDLQRIIREELQNALNESIQIGWNGNKEKPIKIDVPKEKDGIYITNEREPGRWFIPSDDIPKLIKYLQGLNLEPFNPDGSDSELNPSLVRMVKQMGRR